MTTTMQTTLTGTDAIRYAEQNGLTLSKYADPTEGAREGLTVDEARDVAAQDPGLIWIDRIATAADLDALCAVLNDICEATAEGERPDYGPYTTSKDLPTFGGSEPDETGGVFSWDASGLLVCGEGPDFCKRTREWRSERRPWSIIDRE